MTVRREEKPMNLDLHNQSLSNPHVHPVVAVCNNGIFLGQQKPPQEVPPGRPEEVPPEQEPPGYTPEQPIEIPPQPPIESPPGEAPIEIPQDTPPEV